MKQTDIYTEALLSLRTILLIDHPHLQAYGGMGSFNDLPYMKGDHDYIFGFLKSVCYAFGHLYHKRQDVTTEALMEECTYDAAQAAYHQKKELNQAIVKHLIEGDLHENLDSLQENSP